MSPTNLSDEDNDEADKEVTFILGKRHRKKKDSGRRAKWSAEQLDDLIDVRVNNENFKEKLIFTNNRRATNTEIYKRALDQIKERQPIFPFTVDQMRNKFKWCVSTCKKVALTIQTATGIKRFAEDKAFGKWFDALFPLIKSRDSCQPERAIEPSTSSSTSSTPIDHMNDNSIPGDFNYEDVEAEEKERKDMFVPTRKRKGKPSDSQSMSKILKIVEHMRENDQQRNSCNS